MKQVKPAMINTNSNSCCTQSGLNGLLRPLQGGSNFSKASQLITPQVRDHAGRDLGLTRFDDSKAAALLNDKLGSSVGGALAAKGTSALAGQGGDFSPEKIARNILSFIDTAIGSARANGGDPAAIQKKQAEAKAAVEKGFAEAKDILQSFGAWNGAVKDNAEKTLGLIQKGLDDRAAVGNEAVPAVQSSAAVQTANLAALDTKRAETFDMEIKTREGDIVKLSYSVNQSAGFKASRVADGNGVSQEVSAYSSRSENLLFSVQGDLNDDEKKAIDDLMKNVDTLAKDFYSGDMQGAMQRAMALDMNKEQLSSLSLDLSYTQSRSAISAYREVGALDPNTRPPLRKAEVGTIGDFNKDLQGMLREASRFFQDADKLVQKLFRDIAPEASNEVPGNGGKNSLRDLLNGLISAASNRVDQEKATTPNVVA